MFSLTYGTSPAVYYYYYYYYLGTSGEMIMINTHRAHPFFTTLTAHEGIFLPPDGKSIISRTP